MNQIFIVPKTNFFRTKFFSLSMAMFGMIAVPPNGTHFLLIVLIIIATLVGKLFTLARMPALLGMLITGIALKNLPGSAC
jgi:hypothetical protein